MVDYAITNCGSDKRDQKSVSWKLYDSLYFESRMSTAMMLGRPFIVSAKHGLVRPSDRLEPYDASMSSLEEYEKDSWALGIVTKIPPNVDSVYLLTSKAYSKPLKKMLLNQTDVNIYDCFVNCSGIGEHKGWCKTVSEKLERGIDKHEIEEIPNPITWNGPGSIPEDFL